MTRGKIISIIGLLSFAMCVCVLFIALGMWQLDRAEQKSTVFAEFEQRGNASLLNLNQADFDDAAKLSGYSASATGHYVGSSILLDNQIHQGRAGYFVYSTFELNGRKQSLLINRGWIASSPDRSRAPEFTTPTADLRLNGRLSHPPVGGLRLEGSEMVESLAEEMWRVQTIDFSDLSSSFNWDLMPITLLLDEEATTGFVREWLPPGNDEARHLGYAFQWFAMAATVVVMSSLLTLRSIKAGLA